MAVRALHFEDLGSRFHIHVYRLRQFPVELQVPGFRACGSELSKSVLL